MTPSFFMLPLLALDLNGGRKKHGVLVGDQDGFSVKINEIIMSLCLGRRHVCCLASRGQLGNRPVGAPEVTS
jgi:hypothetical protein